MKQLTQPLKWHVVIDDVRAQTGVYCWCRCECGTYRLVRRDSLTGGGTNCCGCVGRSLASERRKSATGELHPNFKGGHWNRGTEAWANKLLRQAVRYSQSLGHAAPQITASELVGLFRNFPGDCPICSREIDKSSGRQLCLDHCHKTGRVRGFICHHCNACLGWLENRQDEITNYLKEPAI